MQEPPRWLSAEEQQAWRGFVRVHDRLRLRLGRELQADSGLSFADYAVLVELTDVPEGRRRFLELARAVEWEKSRMSHHIARMAKRGLVVREECPDDGRGAFVVITRQGREALEAAAPRHVAAVRRAFIDRLTPQEIRVLADLTRRVLGEPDEQGDSCG